METASRDGRDEGHLLTGFLKLGTSLRYLIDVRAGDTLGGKYILSNLDTVLSLVKELGFEQTASTAAYQRMVELHAELKAASAEVATIGEAQRARLEDAGRKVRASLFTEAAGKRVRLVDPEAPARGGRAVRALLTAASVLLLGAGVDRVSALQWVGFWRAAVVASAVLVLAVTAIWSARGLAEPRLWLAFVALVASSLLVG